MIKVRVLPYKPGSLSAKKISKALNGLRVRFDGGFKPRLRHLVVNWGKAAIPRWWPAVRNSLNRPEAVQRASNKLVSFRTMEQAGVVIPPYTTDQTIVRQWLAGGQVVVARCVLNGHSGIGCVVMNKDREKVQEAILTDAPLYTQHLRHKKEYRVHVFKGTIIDAVEKRRKRGYEGRDKWIRNHANGWIFCRDGLTLPEVAKTEAIKACAALGLDFGAVDIGYREKENKAYVFEINTAPGIEGTTINSYINAIRQHVGTLANV